MSNSTDFRTDRGIAALRVLFLGALAVSVAHYLDTWLRYDAYASVAPHSPVQPWMMPVGWLVFTAIGIVGLVQLSRRRWWPAAALFAVYSLSGLIMVMHYVDAPPGDYSASQNVMIVIQLIAGAVMLGGALWLTRRALSAPDATRAAGGRPSMPGA